MRKYLIVLWTALLMICFVYAVHAETAELKIDSISANQGETVEVPISISENTGIAGAVIKIIYDENLTFNGVRSGSAFSSLTFTPPKDLNVKPIILLWDGLEEDNTNGTIAILSFTAPLRDGVFDISAEYDNGGIYDGDLNDINVGISNGSIYINDDTYIEAEGDSSINVQLHSKNDVDGIVFVASYDADNKLIEVRRFDAKNSFMVDLNNSGITAYVKVMWWYSDTLMKPKCKSKTIFFK